MRLDMFRGSPLQASANAILGLDNQRIKRDNLFTLFPLWVRQSKSKNYKRSLLMQKKNVLSILCVLVVVFILFGVNIQTSAVDAANPAAKPPTRTRTPTAAPTATSTPTGATGIQNIIPEPVSVSSTGGTFTLPGTAAIYVNPATTEMLAIGQYLAHKLN